MRLLSVVIVLGLFAVSLWADDLTLQQTKALVEYQKKIDEANGIAPPATMPAPATQPSVAQLSAQIQVLTDDVVDLKNENARLRRQLAATTKASDPATLPPYPPPLGTSETMLVSKWQATKQGDVYVLPNGANIKCQNERVAEGWLIPTVGMDETVFVNYNYGNYRVDNQDANARFYGYRPAANAPKTPHVKSVVVNPKTKKIIAVEK